MTSTSSLPPPSIPSLGGQDTQMSPLSAPTNPNSTEKHMVHWFRKGLRMHDNPSLREGLKGCTTFRCVFILDPWFAGSSNVGINKWRFLLQCLEDLDINLRKLNSRLFVIRGQPADILPKLFKEWKTTCLTFEEDPEPFGKVRDQNIMTLCRELNIEVIARVSHTLYDLDQIIEKNGGKTPLTYHQFQSIVAKMDSPSPAEAPVTPLLVRQATTPLRDDHDEKYGVPTLEELGFDIEGLLPPTWKGGETEAMRRLERHLERKAWVASFGRPKMTPQSLLASQTGLSPFLRFGCLIRRTTKMLKIETPQQSRPRPITTISIPYVQNLSEKIKRENNKLNIRTVFQSQRKIAQLINTPETSEERKNKNVIYKISCTQPDCNKGPYIGETKAQLHVRKNQHKYNLNKMNETSELVMHKINEEHDMDLNSMCIIDHEKDWYKRKFKESAYMKYTYNKCTISNPTIKIKKAPPPLSLHGQLLWREFFYCAATRNPNFDRMLGNPICVQIPWDVNMEALAKWANAQTGFPWIDAIMTQLREEGWIHHLARHAVACFLTRGDLWVSWEEGMKVNSV
ncbi:hypothetical protein M8J76_004297 [Diaphorina citri]|nr:hypothetical protein M8J76_004297 [Diaphorina citri]